MNDPEQKPTMADENVCPQCGTPLTAGPLGGLCPACLLKEGARADTFTGGGRMFEPPPVSELAAKFPQLEILELIGKGGMGAVYKARQRELDRIVALKILPPSIGEAPGFSERFTREARALAKLNHPGIVTIHDFGRADGLFFFLMEYVDGMNLRQLLNAGRIAPREALAIVPQICDALQFAHDHGIVHRDIKPENILLDRRGRVKVADFGLAKLMGADVETAGNANPNIESANLTEAGKIMGTPSYMAPEQTASPEAVDNRADIYALGVVFYQMLTGELPSKRIEPPSKKVQIDVRLDEVVLRALEKNPELRYQQASILKTQVETISEGSHGDAKKNPELPPPLSLSPHPIPPPFVYAGFWRRFLALVIDLILVSMAIFPFIVTMAVIAPDSTVVSVPFDLFTSKRVIEPDAQAPDYQFSEVTVLGKWKYVYREKTNQENDDKAERQLVDPVTHAKLSANESDDIAPLVLLILWIVMESSACQATAGKILLGIRVEDMHRNRVSVTRALGRTAAKGASVITFMVGFLMAGWTTGKQALHDMMAGCYVVVTPERERKYRVAWITMAIAAGLFLAGVGISLFVPAVPARFSTSGNQHPEFSQVTQCEVEEAADLDTGTFADLPEEVTKKDNITEAVLTAAEWLEREKMDLFVDTRSHIFSVGMRVIPQDKDQWDHLSASRLKAVLDASITTPSITSKLEPLEVGSTYVFQTREGGKGILQVLGSGDHGVKIRYKMAWLPPKPGITPSPVFNSRPDTADFVVFHPADKSTAIMDAARDFVIEHKWRQLGERGGNQGVTLEALDGTGKKIAFNETPQAESTARFTITAEPDAEMHASIIGAQLSSRIDLGGASTLSPTAAAPTGWLKISIGVLAALVFIALLIIVVAFAIFGRKSLLFTLPLALLFPLIAVGVLFLFRSIKLPRPASAQAVANSSRSDSPLGERISKNHELTAMVHHDNVDLHYVIFYGGEFTSSGGCTFNTHSLKWLEDYSITLKNGRTFGYQRESVNGDFFLKINGQEFDFRKGRVFELHDDGTVAQLDLFPSLALARDMRSLVKLVVKRSAGVTALADFSSASKPQFPPQQTPTPADYTEATRGAANHPTGNVSSLVNATGENSVFTATGLPIQKGSFVLLGLDKDDLRNIALAGKTLPANTTGIKPMECQQAPNDLKLDMTVVPPKRSGLFPHEVDLSYWKFHWKFQVEYREPIQSSHEESISVTGTKRQTGYFSMDYNLEGAVDHRRLDTTDKDGRPQMEWYLVEQPVPLKLEEIPTGIAGLQLYRIALCTVDGQTRSLVILIGDSLEKMSRHVHVDKSNPKFEWSTKWFTSSEILKPWAFSTPAAASIPSSTPAANAHAALSGQPAAGEDAPVSAALEWLKLIDKGDYAGSWDAASASFQNSFTQDAWAQLEGFRKPIGALTKRTWKGTAKINKQDDIHVVIQFVSSFESKSNAVETVTVTLEKDGKWQVSGYYIK